MKYVLLFAIMIGILTISLVMNFPKEGSSLLSQLKSNSSVSVLKTEDLDEKSSAAEVDLSAILMYSGRSSRIELFDSNQKKVSESYYQEPIADPYSGATNKGMTVLEYSKPKSEEFMANAYSVDDSGIKIFMYDRSGEVNIFEFTGREISEDATFKISFNKDNKDLTSVEKRN